MKKHVRELVTYLRRRWPVEVEVTQAGRRNPHLRLSVRHGGVSVILITSASPSDRRCVKNTERDMRAAFAAAGVILERKDQ